TDSMNERKIPGQKFIADDGCDACSIVVAESAQGGFQLFGPHVVCRHVDQVAGEEHTGKLPLDIDPNVVGKHKPDLLLLVLPVAAEHIAPQTEAERDFVGCQRALDMPVAGRKEFGEPAGCKCPFRFTAEAEECRGQLAVRTRNEEQAAWL